MRLPGLRIAEDPAAFIGNHIHPSHLLTVNQNVHNAAGTMDIVHEVQNLESQVMQHG